MSNKTPKESAKKTKSAPSVRLLATVGLLLVCGIFVHALLKNKGDQPTLIIPNIDMCMGASLRYEPMCDYGIQYEKALNSEQHTKGLSGRSLLPSDKAMLFVFDQPGRQCIWMKDMKFAIDILWLNEKREIVKVEKNVSPETYPATFCAENTKYVVELNEGVFESAKLKLGDRLQL